MCRNLTTYNAADSYSEDGTKVFDFKSAFEIYKDSENAINDDVLSEVITGLSNALEIDTIRNIDKFIESFDLSKVPDDSVTKTKEAIKSVLCNIASSYGLSDSIYYSYDKNGKLKQTQETIKYSNSNYTYIFKDGKGNLKEEQKVIFNKNENLTTYDTTFSDGGRFVHKTIDTENSHIASYEEYADGELVSITHSEYDKNYLNG